MPRATTIALALCLVCAAFTGTGVAAESAVVTENAVGSESALESDPEAKPNVDSATVASPTDASNEPRIVAAYPNPVSHGDRGEYVELWLPPDRDALVLTDGQTTVRLAGNVSGRVVVAAEPNEVHVDGDPHTVAASGLALANTGATLQLRDPEGRVRHAVTYDRAPEGQRWNTTAAEWRPLGYEPRDPNTYDGTEATVFTLPDLPTIPRSTLRDADDRLLLAGYTLTSEKVVRALVAAHDRGVTVRVLLEGSPVGGIDRRQAVALDRLTTAGVDVTVLDGARSRFAYHHAKYAVVDDETLVLTENWKPAGTGGRGSRGWGVRASNPTLAADLAALFNRDAAGIEATAWEQYRRGRTFDSADPATGDYARELEAESVHVRRMRLLTAPGNAEGEMVDEIDSAESSLVTLQPTIERESALVRACLRAASRGVEVRILLSDAWYVVEDNRDHVAALNDHAERRNLPLTARIADPRGQYEKVHAKGLVVDERTAYVGSLNWNSQAAARNREVVLELRGNAAAGYFAAAFDADWERSGERRPVGIVIAAIVAACLAAVVARERISFGNGEPVAVATENRRDGADGREVATGSVAAGEESRTTGDMDDA